MSDENDIRDEFGERLWKTPKEIIEEIPWQQGAAELLAFIQRGRKRMPIDVRPEFMDAAEKFLAEWEPSTNWKDTCLCLTVAAFGQQQFEKGQGNGRQVPDGGEDARTAVYERALLIASEGDLPPHRAVAVAVDLAFDAAIKKN